MDLITSVKNPAVALFRTLSTRKGRQESGLFLVEGAVMIREALSCGLKPRLALGEEKHQELLEALSAAGAQTALAKEHVIAACAETVSPQGILAAFTLPEELRSEHLPPRLIVLDGVQDPGNCGTIWRTADAAGFQGIVFGKGAADPLSPKVQRAAMGSGFRVGYCWENLETFLPLLRERGYSILSSALDGEDFYQRRGVNAAFALVIGSEAHGISPATRAHSTHVLKLPMRGGAESLNAAVAAGIMMYELTR